MLDVLGELVGVDDILDLVLLGVLQDGGNCGAVDIGKGGPADNCMVDKVVDGKDILELVLHYMQVREPLPSSIIIKQRIYNGVHL